MWPVVEEANFTYIFKSKEEKKDQKLIDMR